jgi:hypothetical protein
MTASYTDYYGTEENVEIPAIGPIINIDKIGTIGDIAGTTAQGNILKVGAVVDSDGIRDITYQWSQEKDKDADTYSVIKGETSPTLKLTQDQIDNYIKITVTYTDKTSNESRTLTSAPTETAVTDVDDLGFISDIETEDGEIAEQGEEKVRLQVGTITDPDGYVEENADPIYTWQIADDNDDSSVFTDINSSKAAAKTFLLTQNEVLKYIRIKAKYTDEGNTSSEIFSKAIGPIKNVNDDATFGDIKGKPDEGIELSAGDISDDDGFNSGILFQWYISDDKNGTYKAIEDKGDFKIFALTQKHVGKYLKVTAKFTDAGNTDEELKSDPIGPINNINNVGHITDIQGIEEEGKTLTAGNISDVDGYNNDATYQWKVYNKSSGKYENIEINATSNEFNLTNYNLYNAYNFQNLSPDILQILLEG